MAVLALKEQLASVAAAREQRKVGAGEKYHKLIVDTTDGVETDPAIAAEILHDAERSVEQLEADCVLLKKRRQWAATIAKAESAPQDIAKAEAEIGRLRSELNKICDDFNQQIAVQRMAVAAGSDTMTGALTAKKQLEETAWQFIKDEQAELQREIAASGQHHQQVRIELKRLGEQADRQETMSQPQPDGSRIFVTPRDRKINATYAKESRKKIKETERTLSEQQKVTDALLARVAELQAKRLVP